MKKTLISIAAVSTLAAAAVAVPAIASAQPYGGQWRGINQRQENLDRRIDRGVQNGSLTRREAVRLRWDFRQLVRLENRYRNNGLNRWERADLNRRFDTLSARIRHERRDRQDRRYGYGYGYRN